MAEKVALLGIARDQDCMYYVQDGAVWKVARSGRSALNVTPERVADGTFEMDANYVYFVDEDGDVARERQEAASRRRSGRPPTPAAVQQATHSHDTPTPITHGLQIMKKAIDKILAGSKTWEIRGKTTSRRGPIALIQSKTGLVVGTCEIIDVVGPLSRDELQRNEARTGFRADALSYDKTYAWVLRNARRLTTPIPFRHPRGAVIWIKLEQSVIDSLKAARASD